MSYTIGIDLGIASVGFAVLHEGKVIHLGSRIFRDGRDAESHQTDNTARRTARHLRRQYKRQRQRRSAVYRAIAETINPSYRTDSTLPNLPRKELLSSIDNFEGQAFLDVISCVFRFLSKSRGPSFEWKEPEKRVSGVKRKMDWLRSECEAEFSRLWDIGVSKRPDIFTEAARERIGHAIFFQRPLKVVENIGPCQFLDGKRRGQVQSESVQRLAIRSALANLSVVFKSGEVVPLCEYSELMDEFEKLAWSKNLTFAKIRKAASEFVCPSIFHRIGGEEGQVAIGRKGIGPAKLDTIDAEGNSILAYASLSERAAEMLYAVMVREKCREGTAIKILRDGGAFLPIPDIRKIPDGRAMLGFDEVVEFKRDGDWSDPSIRVSYGQVKAVLDDIMSRLPPGAQVRVKVETAKQVGRGTAARRDYIRFQRANRERNAAEGTASLVSRVKALFGSTCCVCGKPVTSYCHAISASDNGPRTVANGLPLCDRCNAEMGSRTPWQWGRDNEEARLGFARHVAKVEKMLEVTGLDPVTKGILRDHLWRFEKTARDTFLAGFRPGALEMMRPLETLIRIGVAPIDKKVVFVRSKAVSKLRGLLRLPKDRTDHRHHAIDAALVALCEFDADGRVLRPSAIDGEALVDQAVVVHRPDRSKAGTLHREGFAKHNAVTPSMVAIGSAPHVRYVHPHGNWCLEVFELPNGRLKSVLTTRFAANQPGYRAGVTGRPHPCAKVKMRIHLNDTLKTPLGTFRASKLRKTGVLGMPLEWGGKAEDCSRTYLSTKILGKSCILHQSPSAFMGGGGSPAEAAVEDRAQQFDLFDG